MPSPDRTVGTSLAVCTALLLVACGGSEDPFSEVPDAVVPGGAAPVTGDLVVDDEAEIDAAVRRLEARLTTRVVDADNHDSWLCLGETFAGETLSSEYRLTVDADGTRRGLELDGHGQAETTAPSFGWAGIAADSALLDYVETGRQTELSSILFADDDAFRASDGASGTLECRRQRYVDGDPTRSAVPIAPEDVDRDAEAATELAARVETRRFEGGDFWSCDSEAAPLRGYLFAAADVLDEEPRALIVEARAVGEALRAFDPTSDDTRTFRWLATDGATLVLVPLDVDVAAGEGAEGTVATDTLADIVFAVDDAFVATDGEGRTLQCLRSPL